MSFAIFRHDWIMDDGWAGEADESNLAINMHLPHPRKQQHYRHSTSILLFFSPLVLVASPSWHLILFTETSRFILYILRPYP